MNNQLNKPFFKSKKIIILAFIFVSLLGFGLYIFKVKDTDITKKQQSSLSLSPPKGNLVPYVISTFPSSLEGALILPTQTIQITFSDPVVNTDELKHKMDPEDGKYKLKLSDDRKTLFIIPSPTFDLGRGYTFFILSNETKFDQSKKLDGDIIYHFRTISYNGV